jgi:4-amino-4-deoxy-L-arabinose transferase-like glycosyltransferase
MDPGIAVGRRQSAWALVPVVMFLVLAAASIAWLWLDEAPLIFDPSAHLFSALYFDSFPRDYLNQERQYYPPFVHVVFATLLRFTDYRIDLSVGIIDLFFLGVLLGSTYALGKDLWSPRAGAFATILLALYPATYIHSRSLLLDLPLTAMVAAAMLALVKSRRLSDPGWSTALGLSCAVGILTKQMFVAVIIGPLAYDLLRSPREIPRLDCVAYAVIPTVFAFGWWYVPRMDWFLGEYRDIQEAYARSRGDPDTWGFTGLTYYLVGTWHQTTLVFAVLWIGMLPWFLRVSNRGICAHLVDRRGAQRDAACVEGQPVLNAGASSARAHDRRGFGSDAQWCHRTCRRQRIWVRTALGSILWR